MGPPTCAALDPEQDAAALGLSANGGIPPLRTTSNPKTVKFGISRTEQRAVCRLVSCRAILLILVLGRTAKNDWPRYLRLLSAAVLLFNEALLGALACVWDSRWRVDRSATTVFFWCRILGKYLCACLPGTGGTARGGISSGDRRLGRGCKVLSDGSRRDSGQWCR